MGEIYDERKESGNNELPILTVSIHTGVSDGELDEDSLGKRVKRSEDKSLYKIAKRGDLVFNMMRAWQGAIGSVRTTGMVSPAYIVAKPKYKIDSMFFDYMVKTKTMINRIHRLSYGVTDFRLRLYWDAFVSINCSIPKISEQYKISSFLSLLDNRITKQRELIEKLKTYKRGVLSKIFSEKLVNSPKNKIGNVTTTFSGGTPKVGIKEYYDGIIPFIRSGDIHKNFAEVYISELGLNNSSAKMVNKGDLLYALYGATSGEVDISKIDGAINQAILCIRSDCINIRYLAYWLEYSKEDIISKMLQGGQGNLSAELVKSLSFPIPNDNVQKKVVQLLSILSTYINKSTEQLDVLSSLKSALLQQMFI